VFVYHHGICGDKREEGGAPTQTLKLRFWYVTDSTLKPMVGIVVTTSPICELCQCCSYLAAGISWRRRTFSLYRSVVLPALSCVCHQRLCPKLMLRRRLLRDPESESAFPSLPRSAPGTWTRSRPLCVLLARVRFVERWCCLREPVVGASVVCRSVRKFQKSRQYTQGFGVV
jgi:hypothetical protein